MERTISFILGFILGYLVLYIIKGVKDYNDNNDGGIA